MKSYLIDPENITKFDCDDEELQLAVLFWICAAGKKATTVARGLDNMLSHGEKIFNVSEPFSIVRSFGSQLSSFMKFFGIGCYNNKSRSMLDIAQRNLDLRSCTVSDLESVYGIGPKTARCFLLHSRKNARFAGLDTHVLKYMRDNGVKVPKTTPSGKKYLDLEIKFLEMADKSGKTIAEFDLEIWRKYSRKAQPLANTARKKSRIVAI